MSTLHEDYEEIFSSTGGKLVSLLEIEKVLNLLERPSNQLVLDIGTGTGRVARHLLKLDNDVVGVDISSKRLKNALKKAKRELGEKASNYQVVMADGHYLPFRTSAFDVIISIRTLKYFKKPNLVFHEIARILKHGGICVVELSNVFGYEGLWLLSLKLLNRQNYAQNMGSYYRLFNIFEIEKNLKNLNLTIISKTGWHKIPTIFFIKCKNFTILKILLHAELVLEKFFPFFLFSRGIVMKIMHFKKIR